MMAEVPSWPSSLEEDPPFTASSSALWEGLLGRITASFSRVLVTPRGEAPGPQVAGRSVKGEIWSEEWLVTLSLLSLPSPTGMVGFSSRDLGSPSPKSSGGCRLSTKGLGLVASFSHWFSCFFLAEGVGRAVGPEKAPFEGKASLGARASRGSSGICFRLSGVGYLEGPVFLLRKVLFVSSSWWENELVGFPAEFMPGAEKGRKGGILSTGDKSTPEDLGGGGWRETLGSCGHLRGSRQGRFWLQSFGRGTPPGPGGRFETGGSWLL